MSADRPLQGRVVLLTRPAGRSAPLAARLAALGARTVARPTIAFDRPTDPRPMEEAAAGADGYDWIAVTSPQGAQALCGAWRRAGRPGAGPVARLAAVGEGTARALRELGLRATLVGGGDAESLGTAMAEAARSGERVLVVRPETARDVLPEALAGAGLRVEAVAFYRTVAAADLPETARRVAGREFDGAVFSSPSTFQRLREAGEGVAGFDGALHVMRRVAIGRVTASALWSAGFPAAAIARSASDDGLVEALLRAFST
jgi:uroporphyrinogen-III synthase